MGYAVDYKSPTAKRGKAKKRRTTDIRNAVRWNLPRLTHDTTGTDTVERQMLIRMLRLDRVAPTADPTGDHTLQQLIAMGVISRPQRRDGRQLFQRDDLITALTLFARAR